MHADFQTSYYYASLLFHPTAIEGTIVNLIDRIPCYFCILLWIQMEANATNEQTDHWCGAVERQTKAAGTKFSEL